MSQPTNTPPILEEDEENKVVEINIAVIDAKILKGPKTEPFISYVLVEFGDNVLGTSDHVELQEDNTFHYNLTVKLFCDLADNYKLNELISKPVILTVYESAGFSKKTKDTIPLCRCSVDFLPIILDYGVTQNRRYVLEFIEPPKKQLPIEPFIELQISFDGFVLNADVLHGYNILQFTLESCCSLPKELLAISNGEKYIVMFSLPLIIKEIDEMIIFRHGVIEKNFDPNEIREKKWYTAGFHAAGKTLYIADSRIVPGMSNEDVGDFQDEKDREFRASVEKKEKIVWNSEFRSIITPEATSRLIRNIRSNKFLPLEFARMSVNGLTHCAVAYVNLSPILFPGVTEMRAAIQLHPLSENEIKTKANKSSLLIHSSHSKMGLSNVQLRKGKEGTGDKATADKSVRTASRSESPTPSVNDAFSEDAVIFEESRTYLIIKINLQHPLVPQRLPEEIKQKLTELVPQRNILFPKLDPAQKAVEDFGTQVCNTAALLLEDYKNLLIKDAAGSQTKDRLTTQDYRKTKFIHELKKSGKYFACKEQLKYHVVRIVREKFMKRSAFESTKDFEEFLSTLYVYLIEEMHKNLHLYLSMTDPTPSPNITSVSGIGELKYFAADAFAVGRSDLAKKYHEIRISQFRNEPRVWVDYGIFCLSIDDPEKAAECFFQAVSLDQDYFRGLILYGLVCDICGRSDQTEVFLLHAINSQSNSALARTLLGLYYHGIGNSIGAESYYKQALQLMRETELPQPNQAKYSASLISVQIMGTDQTKLFLNPDDQASNEPSIFISSLPFLLNCNMKLYAQRALAQELTVYQCKPPFRYHQYLAKLNLQEGNLTQAESAVREALEHDNLNPEVWSLSGHIYYALGNKTKAKLSFNRALAIVKQPSDMHIIYYKLGMIALEDEEYENSKKYFLLTCKHSPSCLSWVGVGRASYHLGDWVDAEDALSEANILDNTNPEVWGYLTLVCLRTGRKDEVEQAYRFTLKCNLKDQQLLDQIHSLSEELGINLTAV